MMDAKIENLIFDFDGVICATNELKTEIFGKIGLEYGVDASKWLMEINVSYGGISRFIKFEMFFDYLQKKGVKILQKKSSFIDEKSKNFSSLLESKIEEIQVDSELIDMLRSVSSKYKLLIISGGSSKEIERILINNDILQCFDSIKGNEASKIQHFQKLSNEMIDKSIYFGDSKYDADVARQFSVQFLFLFRMTEFTEWREYCKLHNIKFYPYLKDFLRELTK